MKKLSYCLLSITLSAIALPAKAQYYPPTPFPNLEEQFLREMREKQQQPTHENYCTSHPTINHYGCVYDPSEQNQIPDYYY